MTPKSLFINKKLDLCVYVCLDIEELLLLEYGTIFSTIKNMQANDKIIVIFQGWIFHNKLAMNLIVIVEETIRIYLTHFQEIAPPTNT